MEPVMVPVGVRDAKNRFSELTLAPGFSLTLTDSETTLSLEQKDIRCPVKLSS